MARTLKLVEGSGTGGEWVDPQDFLLTPHAKPLIDDIRLFAAAALFKDKWAGGDEVNGIPALATGDKDLLHWIPIAIQNVSSQLSGFSNSNGATFAVKVNFMVRVSNAAISVTPKVWRATTISGLISSPTAATISGQAACTATNADYSGSNQIQSVTVTIPAALTYLKAALTIGGTPASMYQIWGRAWVDCCVTLP